MTASPSCLPSLVGRFQISDSPIDSAALRLAMDDPTCGALVTFEGLVRNHHEGRDVRSLKYTHHPAMAEKEGQRVLEETLTRFDISHALAIHRIGDLEIGDIAVITITAAAHRDAAFEANRYLIDAIKFTVPIWKYETYAHGVSEWTAPCPRCAGRKKEHICKKSL